MSARDLRVAIVSTAGVVGLAASTSAIAQYSFRELDTSGFTFTQVRDVANGMAVGFGVGMDLDGGLLAFPWYVRWPLRFIMRKQLTAVKAVQANQAQTPEGAEKRRILDLHKSWHGLHWLICQSPWDGPEPLRHAILGGHEVGEDVGYGPARTVDPQTVRQVAAALASLSAAQIMKRYDAREMEEADIYPGGFEEDSSWKREMKRDFERLRKFYEEAAASDEGVIAWIQ